MASRRPVLRGSPNSWEFLVCYCDANWIKPGFWLSAGLRAYYCCDVVLGQR